MAGRNSRSGAVPSILHFHTRMPRQVSEDRGVGVREGARQQKRSVICVEICQKSLPDIFITVHQCSPL